ncbi:UvrD-helicase domain-containing protein [Akkermansiaceae bacterium]|nr:UvrD-helicase domain-containing protein [Akkermansiaceae bacterium]
MIPFDPSKTALARGLTLIEAGAGTGKTYSLVRVVARKVVELEIPLEQILIVTFTKAATAEIHTRLFNLFSEIHDQLEGKAPVDAEPIDLAEKWQASANKPDYLSRLKVALSSFDQAAIFTIDGFFQRLQQENSLSVNLPQGFDIITNDRDLIDQSVQHYWRKKTYTLSAPEYLRFTSILSKSKLNDFLETYRDNPSAKLADEYQLGKADIRNIEEKCLKLTDFLVSHREKIHAFVSLEKPAGSSAGAGKLWSTAKITKLLNLFAEGNEKALHCVTHNADSLKTVTSLGYTNIVDNSWNKAGMGQRDEFVASHDLSIFQRLESLLEGIDTTPEVLYSAYLGSATIEVSEHLEKLKRKLKVQSHNDVTNSLHTVLMRNDGSSNVLVRAARNRYKATLIDEFQDTSPQQCEIFTALFSQKPAPQEEFDLAEDNHPVAPYFFIIGDPKQSIYKFRGADVFSYLKVAQLVQQSYSLTKNFRSSHELVNAVNQFFTQVDDPFLTDRKIQFYPAESNMPPQTDSSTPALSITITGEDDPSIVAKDVTNQIIQLLESGARASEIAVLARNSAQALTVQQTLSMSHVPSALQTSNSVFQSSDAKEFSLLLHSLHDPKNQKIFRAVLLLPCMGRGEMLANLDHSALEKWNTLHELWQQKGLLTMLRKLEVLFPIKQNYLRFDSTARKVTNFLHLAELTQSIVQKKNLTPGSTIEWLDRAITDGEMFIEGDESVLRLSSDREAVQILTQHKAKGLEYEHVFIPFALRNQSERSTSLIYHDEQDNACIATSSGHTEERKKETKADEIRLFYVALTRAKSHCYLYYYAADKPKNLFDNILTDEDMDIYQFISLAGNTMALNELDPRQPVAQYSPAVSDIGKLTILDISQLQIRQRSRTSSFTGITRNVEAVADYDSFSTEKVNTELELTDPTVATEAWEQDELWAEFQAGASLGLVVHEVLEVIDFQLPTEVLEKKLILLCQQKLLQHQPFFKNVLPNEKQLYALSVKLAALITTWMDHDLGDGLQLSTISNATRLNEPRFLLKTEDFHLNRFAEYLRNNPPPHMPVHYPDQLSEVSAYALNGFLDGFIDLVFYHDGRYHILDWKTNGITSNAPAFLGEKMAHSHYYIQYHIYLLALDRILQTKLGSSYVAQEHLGNVYYVFLRGIDLNAPASGIYTAPIHTHDIEVLRNLI